MDDPTLKKLQDTEFEIMCVLDDFCAAHGIRYSLLGGTLLGAVRHGGFIPWDDDVDVAMTRTEFDRFCKEWQRNGVQGYYLESILTDAHCGICHAKVRKNGTVFLSEDEVEGEGHHGIWVDIFPLDKVSTNARIRAQKYLIGAGIIFYTRANAPCTNDPLSKKIVRGIFGLIPASVRQKRLIKMHQWLLDHTEDGTAAGYVWKNMACLDFIKDFSYSPDAVSGYTTLEFCGKKFPVFENYKQMLHAQYGDYMQLPPEPERVCKHHPAKIEF